MPNDEDHDYTEGDDELDVDDEECCPECGAHSSNEHDFDCSRGDDEENDDDL